MIAFLHRLFTGRFCTPRRSTGARRKAVLSLERLEERDTPSAFTGLTIAASHLIPGSPIAPPLTQAPVFALNFEVPPKASTPLNALIGAYGQLPGQPIRNSSPVFVGVEAFLLNSGGTITGVT